MKGILTESETGDICIAEGMVAIGEATSDVAERVMLSAPGDFKECPLVGLFVSQHIGGNALSPFWCGRARRQLNEQGVPAERVSLSSDGTIVIE